MDFWFAAKIFGAVAVFALGLWLGFGAPGLKQARRIREWRSADRLRATWINRVFFNMGGSPRRFDTGRLVVPKEESEEATAEGEAKSKTVVRLRR